MERAHVVSDSVLIYTLANVVWEKVAWLESDIIKSGTLEFFNSSNYNLLLTDLYKRLNKWFILF